MDKIEIPYVLSDDDYSKPDWAERMLLDSVDDRLIKIMNKQKGNIGQELIEIIHAFQTYFETYNLEYETDISSQLYYRMQILELRVSENFLEKTPHKTIKRNQEISEFMDLMLVNGAQAEDLKTAMGEWLLMGRENIKGIHKEYGRLKYNKQLNLEGDDRRVTKGIKFFSDRYLDFIESVGRPFPTKKNEIYKVFHKVETKLINYNQDSKNYLEKVGKK